MLVTEGEHDEPSTQPASVILMWVDAAVDEDVVAALHFDLEGGAVASSSFALPVQNRFSVLDSTVRGSDEMVPTVVDGSGVEVPHVRNAAVELPLEQSDEFQGHNTGGRFLDGVP